MKNHLKIFIKAVSFFMLFLVLQTAKAQTPPPRSSTTLKKTDSIKAIEKSVDTIKLDSVKKPLKYPFAQQQKGSLFLNDVRKLEVVYDPVKGHYVFLEKVGNYYIDHPLYMTKDEYKKYRLEKDIIHYFKSKTSAVSGNKKDKEQAQKNLLPKYYVKSEFFENIFGGNEIEVSPQGSVLVKLGVLYQKVENPQLSERNRSSFTFDFDQEISASLNARVGKRLRVNANFDTESTFNFQNQIKIEYTPTEDDIVRKIEVGNVSMPIQSSLISGAQNLFGVKTQLQFGKTTITGVFSQQRSQTRSVAAQGGATITEFELRASNYDDNRHFFLSHYFRDNFNDALSKLPLIKSNVYINRIEVWVTNRNNQTEDVRNIVALADLGESNSLNFTPGSGITSNGTQENPRNNANNLDILLGANSNLRSIATVNSEIQSRGFNLPQGTGYSLLENARKLILGQDFTLNPQLGYITLNRRLADSEVLAVAYEYTDNSPTNNPGENVFRVGELSADGVTAPSNLVVKLLRSEILNPSLPMWKLMMKNVYALPGAYQLQQDGFRLEVLYQDDDTGVPINFLQNAKTVIGGEKASEIPLLNMLQLDVLDAANNPKNDGDGYFDFVEGVTIDSERGYVIFPRVEPFGDSKLAPNGLNSGELGQVLTDVSDNKYVFDELYNNQKLVAQNDYQNKDKYFLRGYFKAEATNGIPLGAFNVPKGSVVVTSGGRELVEGVDYVVDYQGGNVQVINPNLIASNAPINVSVENNNGFAQQQRRFMGLDIQHIFSEKFAIGGTIVNLNERPFTQKPQFGAEPVNNTMVGFNLNYQTEVPKFTKWVNKLPNIDTDVESNFSIRAEAAYLLPGSPKRINLNGEATSYVDDFEGSQIPLDISSHRQWFLASTPEHQTGALDFDDVNPIAGLPDQLKSGTERSKIAWYSIDRLFYGTQLRPDNIDNAELSRAEVRRINNNEIFPQLQLDVTQTNIVNTFDIAYYPNERGSYNFNPNLDAEGVSYTDNRPEDKWGGIMRSLNTTDFQQANIEYIQFWLLDPYENYSITEAEGGKTNVTPADFGGDLYFNLGNISEDILADDRKMFENGLPGDGIKNSTTVDETAYSNIPKNQSLIYAFTENDNERINQDIGLDGRTNQEEGAAYGLQNLADPANDDYEFYRSSNLDNLNASVLRRYKRYNNTQGNSPTLNNSTESYPTSATSFPDIEDINRDQTMSNIESYYQYKVSLNPSDLVLGKNNIVDIKKDTRVTLPNGQEVTPTWYQFRIPITSGTPVNDINGFNSIRFIRMFLTNFKVPVVLRFGELELVRGDWRRYLYAVDDYTQTTTRQELDKAEDANFEVGVVNIQENENKYVLPPGVQRERLQGSTSVQEQNEQSLLVKVKDLPARQTRLVFKNTTFDMRMFKNLKMFIHASNLPDRPNETSNGDLTAIIRLGSDTEDNFYQVELPLKITESGEISADSIWKNDINAQLREFGKLKLERDALGNNTLNTQLFPSLTNQPNARVRVKGYPNLSNIRTLMIGVRNDANTSKSAELWFNELRVSDFDNKGGWAAVVNADANFADFADISVAGRANSDGFGSLDQRVQERSQENVRQYDLVTNVNVGQLLPKKAGIKIPFNFSYAEEFRDPKWDPKYQDVLFEDAKEINPDSENAQDYTRRKSINLINVRKERTNPEKKPRFYDVENLSVSYSYNENFHRDYNVVQDIDQNVRASANYNYSFKPHNLEPLKNWKFLKKSSYLKFIKDFNINLLPTTISVNSNINRNYSIYQARSFGNLTNIEIPTLRQRRFLFDWDYNVAYNLTKSLQFNFRAANNYIYDTFANDGLDDNDEFSIYQNFFNIGRPNNYHQTLDLSYKLPLNKIPIFDFINATYRYTADFDWQSPSREFRTTVGNTIQNANTHTLSADLNMSKLYRRTGILNLAKKKKRKTKKKKTDDKKIQRAKDGKLSARVGNQSEAQRKKDRKKMSGGQKLLQGVVDVVTSVKKIKVAYSENNGTILPSYEPEIGFLGRNNFNGGFAPTLGFVFGSQSDIRNRAFDSRWLILNNEFSNIYSNTHYEKLDISADVKPFRHLNIEVFANKMYANNTSQQLVEKIDGGERKLDKSFPTSEAGNFSMSYFMLPTAFGSNGDAVFEEFKENRRIISQRLGTNIGTDGYAEGYGPNSSQVLIPAFLATYSGQSASKVKTSAFRNIPLPNWRINYKGFMKYKWFKKRFRSFTLEHRYNSTYSIIGFTNNLQYKGTNNPIEDLNGNYQPDKLFNGINLVEEFNPLVKVDMKMRNNFSLRALMKKDRVLNLNVNNNTVTEIRGNEYVFGLGYRIKDVKLKIRTGEKINRFKGDINFKADVSFRRNSTVIRSIDIINNQITGGQNLFSLKLQADYNLNRNLLASFYYDQNSTSYLISNTFPRNSISAGISLRYTIGN